MIGLRSGLATVRRQKLIAVNPAHAGLGNRVRFTLSCEMVAAAQGRDFAYVWPTGRSFGAHFTDLWSYPARRLARVLGRIDESNALSSSSKRHVLRLRSEHAVVGDGTEMRWEERLAELTPTDEVREIFEPVAAQLAGTPYVGVQVRLSRQSHPKTVQASPLSWFVRRMHELEMEWPRPQFFISADTPEVQRELLAAFPHAIALPQAGIYNSREALVKSVADLYLLGGAAHILGPYWSSFVHLARAISGGSQTLETSRRVYPAMSR